jgi:hypothetical protein
MNMAATQYADPLDEHSSPRGTSTWAIPTRFRYTSSGLHKKRGCRRRSGLHPAQKGRARANLPPIECILAVKHVEWKS